MRIVDVNSHSIGIEIVNPGHEFGYKAFPDKQIDAVIELMPGPHPEIRDQILYNVLGHSDIAPRRKEDPGELFPWERLAEEFVGLWAFSREMDFDAAKELLNDKKVFHDHLKAYGYDPRAPFEEVLKAYHRHFYPEKFKEDEDPLKTDLLSAARLEALIRLKKTVKT
jgi:N-acetylmuramoyl-L-alanine amidase